MSSGHITKRAEYKTSVKDPGALRLNEHKLIFTPDNRNSATILTVELKSIHEHKYTKEGSNQRWLINLASTENAYLPSGDPCGSSCGSAISVAANMLAVSLGSETHGSILCPADHNSVVGFKPTVGLTSWAGFVPVLARNDTIGNLMTRQDLTELRFRNDDDVESFKQKNTEMTN